MKLKKLFLCVILSVTMLSVMPVASASKEVPKNDITQTQDTKNDGRMIQEARQPKIINSSSTSAIYGVSSDPAEAKLLSDRYKKEFQFSATQNPQFYSSSSYDTSKYTRLSTVPTSKSETYYDFYGVVNLYQSIYQSDVYVMEMQSNIAGRSYTKPCWYNPWQTCSDKASITRLHWSVWLDNANDSKATVIQWSPTGTIITSEDGQKIPVNINPSIRGINVGNIGTEFNVGKRETKIDSFAQGGSYETNWTKDGGIKDTVDLKATVAYHAPNYTSWRWIWVWDYTF